MNDWGRLKMALTDKLVAIADAIRDKTGSSEKITLDDIPSKIASITGGGIEKFINFYNHDGALIHQYPLGVFTSMAFSTSAGRNSAVRKIFQ